MLAQIVFVHNNCSFICLAGCLHFLLLLPGEPPVQSLEWRQNGRHHIHVKKFGQTPAPSEGLFLH